MKSRLFQMVGKVGLVSGAAAFVYESDRDQDRHFAELQKANPGKNVNWKLHVLPSYGVYRYPVVEDNPAVKRGAFTCSK